MLLVANDESCHFMVVDNGNATFNLRRCDFFPRDLLVKRAAYGSVWEASRDGNLALVPSGALLERVSVGSIGAGADNRDARDGLASQGLSQGAILGMKADGARGSEVVAALISNSSTFAGKTAFAQEKYVRKKQVKHCVRFRVVRPTPAAIADVLAKRMPDRVCCLRGDALGALLAAANVRHGARALVVDDTGGVVLGAVVSAMGGVGTVAHPILDHWTGPAWQHLPKFNLGRLAAAAGGGEEGGLRIITLRYDQLNRWGCARVLPGGEAAAEAEEARCVLPLRGRNRRAAGAGVAADVPAKSTGGTTASDVDANANGEVTGTASAVVDAVADADINADSGADAGVALGHAAAPDELAAASTSSVPATAQAAPPEQEPTVAAKSSTRPTWREDSRKRRRAEAASSSPAAATATAVEAAPESALASAAAAAPPAAAAQAPGSRPASHMLAPTRMGDCAKRLLMQAGMDSIVIVTEAHPVAVALSVVRFAAPSAALAIFCRELQPAAEALRVLRALGICVNLSLTEIFWRPQQVLPERTHPCMVMHGASGYLLRATVAAHPYAVTTAPAAGAGGAAAASAEAKI